MARVARPVAAQQAQLTRAQQPPQMAPRPTLLAQVVAQQRQRQQHPRAATHQLVAAASGAAMAGAVEVEVAPLRQLAAASLQPARPPLHEQFHVLWGRRCAARQHTTTELR